MSGKVICDYFAATCFLLLLKKFCKMKNVTSQGGKFQYHKCHRGEGGGLESAPYMKTPRRKPWSSGRALGSR
jgi:hypothetical protein